jgi:Fe2+ or Zn2+ uptake regulation protein/predicted transcriptional regulator
MNRPLRMTHQREIILDELNKSQTHPTADELYESLKRKLPRISLATVYRNLEILSGVGLIKKLEISGRQKRFEGVQEQHNHVFCTQCQRVDNIPTPISQTPYFGPMQEQGYRITGCRIEFFGICQKCQKKTEHNTDKGVETMGCKTCESTSLNEQQRRILEAMAKNPKASCGSKEIAAATGLESKQISCQITVLKNKGYVASPARCKYAITEQGISILE